MNEILKNLAGLKEGVLGQPYGIDDLFLGAVHNRALIIALNATENHEFLDSFLFRALSAGSTCSIVMNISKLYDRAKEYPVNSLRELFRYIKIEEKTSKIVYSQFDTKNLESVFQPIINYRNKCAAHNEMTVEITWEQIDDAINFSAYVWNQIGIQSNSLIFSPFYEFDDISEKFDCLFNSNQIDLARIAWDNYILKIRASMNQLLI